jgi:hypothetical protein
LTTKTRPRPCRPLGEEVGASLADTTKLDDDPRRRDSQCAKLSKLFGKNWSLEVRQEIERCRLPLLVGLWDGTTPPLPTHIRAEFDPLIRDAGKLSERMVNTVKLRKARYWESVKNAARALAGRMREAPNLRRTRVTQELANALDGPSPMNCACSLKRWADEASLFCAHLCDVWGASSHSSELGAKTRESGLRNRAIRELTQSHKEALRQIYRRDAEKPTRTGERTYLSIVLFKTRRAACRT